MKSYSQFCEAISPTRLAQLKAKGKGDVAKQIMKNDGLQPGRHQGDKEKAKRAAPKDPPGALAVRKPDSTSLKPNPAGKMRVGGGALAKIDKPKSSALTKVNPVKATDGGSTGFKRKPIDTVKSSNPKSDIDPVRQKRIASLKKARGDGFTKNLINKTRKGIAKNWKAKKKSGVQIPQQGGEMDLGGNYNSNTRTL